MIFSWLCVMSENSQRNWFEQSLIENPISFSNLIYNSINYFINFSHYTQAVFANQQSKWMSENCFLDKMCIDLSWKKTQSISSRYNAVPLKLWMIWKCA